MRKQSFENNVRYYTAHHFVFYPLLLVAIGASVYAFNNHPDQKPVWGAIIVIFIFIAWLSYMLRQHYALGNQDRIVRLELRFRYFARTGKRMEPMESKLNFKQLAALRFASDDELPALVDRTIQENLSATQIKKSIQNWLPDTMRV